MTKGERIDFEREVGGEIIRVRNRNKTKKEKK